MERLDCSSDDEEVGVNIWQEPRREPLGAPRDTPCVELEVGTERSRDERLLALEDEQEILSSSVFSLTSHLAQVEFRLRQIQKASPDEKDDMLKALEEFTSRAVGSRRVAPAGDGAESLPGCAECQKLDEKLHRQRAKQVRFVEQLKVQLKDLERFTGGVGAEECLSRHRHIIDNLNAEIDQSLKESSHQPLTADELRHQIDCVVRQYAEKEVSKEEIVSKLQVHIEDMQRFIKLMKHESMEGKLGQRNAANESHSTEASARNLHSKGQRVSSHDNIKTETINLMRKASALIQIFSVSQFGCSSRPKYYPEKHSSSIVAHWGNLRAKLEMSIDSVLNLVTHSTQAYALGADSYDSDSEENAVVLNNVPLMTAVRKHLAVNLRDLLQHGLEGSPEGGTLVPFIGCFPMRSSTLNKLHIWQLILKYYDINNGESFNSTPARKLSQSFNLDIVGGTAISNKQSLLGAIGSILASHTPYKRSYDANFKAFICAALNSHKLVIWLSIILKNKPLINMFYIPTSYVVNTGFQDSLQSLDRLTPYNFDLPVDLAVKQFQNIKDVFM